MSDVSVGLPAPTPPAPGSMPLKSVRKEVYCQQRAVACPPEQAAQRAGYAPRTGAHCKLERKPDVIARIRWLRRYDDELIQRKRAYLEEELRRVIDFDPREFAVIDEATGELIAMDWRKVRDAGMLKAVCQFTFDKDTGRLISFKREDRLNAIAQLRDMYGLRTMVKTEVPVTVTSNTVNLNVSDDDRGPALLRLLARTELPGEES